MSLCFSSRIIYLHEENDSNCLIYWVWTLVSEFLKYGIQLYNEQSFSCFTEPSCSTDAMEVEVGRIETNEKMYLVIFEANSSREEVLKKIAQLERD